MDTTTSRPYRITWQVRSGCLRADVQGTGISLRIVADYWRDVAEECHRRKARRLLVIENLVGPSTDREEVMPELMAEFGRLGLEAVRIAFVKFDTRDLALAELAGLLVRDLGWTARVFTNEAEAQLWLRHGPREGGRS